MTTTHNTINDRKPNWRGPAGELYLQRCFACSPEYGRENWGPAVATGTCAHCGWKEPDHNEREEWKDQ